jgi:hypothetical protein
LSATKSTLPKLSMASERQPVRQELAAPVQRAFVWDRDSRVTALYDIVRQAVAARGGKDALRAALDERESYLATISKALNQQDGRMVPIDWLTTIGEDSEAAFLLAAGINQLLGFAPPVRQRAVTEEDVGRASRELLAEMDDEHQEIYRKKLARKLGVSVDEVKL